MSEMEGTDNNQGTTIKRRVIFIEVFLVTGKIVIIYVSEWHQMFITVVIFRNVTISFFSKLGKVIGMFWQCRYLTRNPITVTGSSPSLEEEITVSINGNIRLEPQQRIMHTVTIDTQETEH